ncbi:hypothetical protein ACFQH6_08410 [Halobacteriaceae archaeon GCM10025711]
MNRTRIVAVLLAASLLVPGVALGAVKGEPNVSVYVPDNTVSPGETTQLSVRLMNTGSVDTGSPQIPDSTVTTARGVSVGLRSDDAPITVHTGRTPIGSLADGQVREVPFSVTVKDDAEPGTYRVPVTVEYEYTSVVAELSPNTHQEEEERETFYVTLKVDDSAHFDVLATSSDVQVGDTGTLEVAMRNAGDEPASEATVTLTSTTGDLVFGKSAEAKRYVGGWEAGENRTLAFDLTATPDADPRTYALKATVSFENANDKPVTSRTFTLGVTPGPEQKFALDDAASSLRVGEEGTVTGTVTNDGPATAHDAVVKLQTQNANVKPLETEFALGTLDAGQSASYEFPVEISDEAEAGPRQFDYVVTYQNGQGDDRKSKTLNAQVDVASRQDRFSVTPVDATLRPGSGKAVTFEVTNNGETTLRNVNAKLFVDSPLATDDDEAFVQQIAPGDTEEITFGMSAGGGALPKTYAVSMDFQYDTADGETKLSDSYQAPVTIEERTDSGLPTTLIAGAVIVVVVLAGGWYWYTRR